MTLHLRYVAHVPVEVCNPHRGSVTTERNYGKHLRYRSVHPAVVLVPAGEKSAKDLPDPYAPARGSAGSIFGAGMDRGPCSVQQP